MPSCSAEPQHCLANCCCHIYHFIKSRLSSLSIKQRNRDWVSLSWNVNSYEFQIKWLFSTSITRSYVWLITFKYGKSEFINPWAVYTSQHFIYPRALMVLFGRHSTCCICPMKYSRCGCLHCYWDAYKISLESQLSKKFQHNIQLSFLTTQRNGHFHI